MTKHTGQLGRLGADFRLAINNSTRPSETYQFRVKSIFLWLLAAPSNRSSVHFLTQEGGKSGRRLTRYRITADLPIRNPRESQRRNQFVNLGMGGEVVLVAQNLFEVEERKGQPEQVLVGEEGRGAYEHGNPLQLGLL